MRAGPMILTELAPILWSPMLWLIRLFFRLASKQAWITRLSITQAKVTASEQEAVATAWYLISRETRQSSFLIQKTFSEHIVCWRAKSRTPVHFLLIAIQSKLKLKLVCIVASANSIVTCYIMSDLTSDNRQQGLSYSHTIIVVICIKLWCRNNCVRF